MGELAKKWMAGLGAAALVTVIAVIAIGKMERKSTPAPSAQLTGSKPAGTSKPVPVQSPPPQPISQQPSAQAEAIQSGQVNLAAPQNAGEKVVNAQTRVAGKAKSSAGPKTTTWTNSTPITPTSNVPAQPQVAQAQAPAAPPDVATTAAQPIQPEAQPATMQVTPPEGMAITGNVTVEGKFSKLSTWVRNEQQVVTPGQNGALVTATGSAIALGADTQFRPQSMNSFMLDGGASNVSTQTGMKEKVKGNWRIEPVHPDAPTQYEVNYENDGIYVYARVNDVDVIHDPCVRRIRVEEGKAIRIPNFRACGFDWLDENGRAAVRTWPYKAAWGSAAAVGTGVVIWIATHQDMSPEHP